MMLVLVLQGFLLLWNGVGMLVLVLVLVLVLASVLRQRIEIWFSSMGLQEEYSHDAP